MHIDQARGPCGSSARILAGIMLSLGIATVSMADSTQPLALTQACEEALALSALPARLRDQSTAYVWQGEKYESTVRSGNQFHCFVARNHPNSVIPVCFTQSGVDSVMPGVMFKSRLAMQGMSTSDQGSRFEAKSAAGEFVAPQSPGINYMMSAFTWIYQSEKNTFWNTPPHVMFFAPGVTEKSIGGASYSVALKNKGVPVAVDSGIHAYMVTFVEHSSDKEAVEMACAGQRFLVDNFSAAE